MNRTQLITQLAQILAADPQPDVSSIAQLLETPDSPLQLYLGEQVELLDIAEGFVDGYMQLALNTSRFGECHLLSRKGDQVWSMLQRQRQEEGRSAPKAMTPFD